MKQQRHDIGYARIAHNVRLYSMTLFTVFQIAISLMSYLMYYTINEYQVELSNVVVISMFAALIISETLLGIYTLIMSSLPFKLICQVLYRNSKSDNLDGFTVICIKLCPPYIRSELNKLNSLLSGDIRKRNQERKGLANLSDVVLKDNILSVMPVGVIILNNNLDIVYNNSLAPIKPVFNRPTIQLDFSNSSISLHDWIIKMQAEEIYGENIWAHIANVPPNSIEDRRIYDVIAKYQRDSIGGMDISIITVDRTDKYTSDESSMDTLTLAAHELRGPITTMRGYIDILRDKLDRNNSKKVLDSIDVSAQKLSAYINNILNASRYDHNSLRFRPQEITLYNILDDVKDDLALRATTAQRQLNWNIPSNLPSIFADRSLIDEVINNFVDNAIKYTKSNGKITITAQVEENFLAISVHDNGIGITPTAMQNLFSKFYRSGRSKQAVGGSGLGLYISRAIIKQHNGFIVVESNEGKGTTFTAWLPLYVPGQDKISDTPLAQPTSFRSAAMLRNHNKIIQ